MNPTSISIFNWLARMGLCIAYVYSGLSKIFDWSGALAEQQHFGMEPAGLFAALTIFVQLGGSAAVLFGRGRWAALGAAALAGFTLLATFIGHAFWNETGMERFHDLNSFLEHFGLIGGFALVALAELNRSTKSA